MAFWSFLESVQGNLIDPINNFAKDFTTSATAGSEVYDIRGEKLALVFNQRIFKNKNLETRAGTDVDLERLKDVLPTFGINVKIFNDARKNEIKRQIKHLQEREDKLALLFIFIMSHGERHSKFEAYDGTMNVESDIKYKLAAENCQCLEGQPKIIFVQVKNIYF